MRGGHALPPDGSGRQWSPLIEREKFIIRQPPIGGKDDYDSDNSWISDGLPSYSIQKVILKNGLAENLKLPANKNFHN